MAKNLTNGAAVECGAALVEHHKENFNYRTKSVETRFRQSVKALKMYFVASVWGGDGVGELESPSVVAGCCL